MSLGLPVLTSITFILHDGSKITQCNIVDESHDDWFEVRRWTGGGAHIRRQFLRKEWVVGISYVDPDQSTSLSDDTAP